MDHENKYKILKFCTAAETKEAEGREKFENFGQIQKQEIFEIGGCTLIQSDHASSSWI